MQGEIGFWDANPSPTQPAPRLEATLCVSTTPVEALIVFGDDDNTIRLHGCLACVCADSSVTIVLLEGFRLQYTIPGRGARLTSIAVRADELLLTYDDDKARVWDLRTQELRRSIATDQAQALVEERQGMVDRQADRGVQSVALRTTGVLSQLASARDERLLRCWWTSDVLLKLLLVLCAGLRPREARTIRHLAAPQRIHPGCSQLSISDPSNPRIRTVPRSVWAQQLRAKQSISFGPCCRLFSQPSGHRDRCQNCSPSRS